jgi:F0F1-type ATP synthase assembly protein I
MTDSTSRIQGNEAPAPSVRPSVVVARAFSASLLGRPANDEGAFDRKAYATETSRGYGSAMSRGIELALTLVVMVGLGWVADRIFGTYPLFTIVFSILGFAGISVKLFLGYDLEMKKHEEGAVWNRTSDDA